MTDIPTGTSAEERSAGAPAATSVPGATKEQSFPCAQCGAILSFAPGTRALKCQYCGHENPIANVDGPVEEQDFNAALERLERAQETTDRVVVKCDTCAAESTKPEHLTALVCPFCGSNIVTTAMSRRLIKPQALLPFAVGGDAATEIFRKWLKRLWFAPRGLAQFAAIEGRLVGMYLPYWTYDCATTTRYSGQRGDNYTVNETYTTTDSKGQRVTRMRQVTRTRWRSVSGVVQRAFDDVLVVASESLPSERVQALEPWDLHALTPYQDEFLSGFRAESYRVSLRDGFGRAQALMDPLICETIRADIGGDHQQISAKHVSYAGIRFKHILLPVWLSAYRYKSRTYRFFINARTGEVQGERPWSWAKITGLIVCIAAVIGIIAFIASR